MKEILEKLLSEYSEFEEDTKRMTFTAENWDKFKIALAEEVEEPVVEEVEVEEPVIEEVEQDTFADERLALQEEINRLKEELNEFVETGWEANGNKLYFKGEEQY